MVRKKMTTYVQEDLHRSAKVLAARTDVKVYEVLEEALSLRFKRAGGKRCVRLPVRA